MTSQFTEEPGEDEELLWTQRGVDSSLGAPAWAVADKPVNDGFLRVQPLSVRQGLELGYWKIQKKQDVQVVPSQKKTKIKKDWAVAKCRVIATFSKPPPFRKAL